MAWQDFRVVYFGPLAQLAACMRTFHDMPLPQSASVFTQSLVGAERLLCLKFFDGDFHATDSALASEPERERGR